MKRIPIRRSVDKEYRAKPRNRSVDSRGESAGSFSSLAIRSPPSPQYANLIDGFSASRPRYRIRHPWRGHVERGAPFPAWQHGLIVGSLRARTLYRLRIEDGRLVDQEKLLTGLARIRDVEIGADGYVYLLLEHGELGTIVRLVPDETTS